MKSEPPPRLEHGDTDRNRNDVGLRQRRRNENEDDDIDESGLHQMTKKDILKHEKVSVTFFAV
jgi:hypothetical protein